MQSQLRVTTATQDHVLWGIGEAGCVWTAGLRLRFQRDMGLAVQQLAVHLTPEQCGDWVTMAADGEWARLPPVVRRALAVAIIPVQPVRFGSRAGGGVPVRKRQRRRQRQPAARRGDDGAWADTGRTRPRFHLSAAGIAAYRSLAVTVATFIGASYDIWKRSQLRAGNAVLAAVATASAAAPAVPQPDLARRRAPKRSRQSTSASSKARAMLTASGGGEGAGASAAVARRAAARLNNRPRAAEFFGDYP